MKYIINKVTGNLKDPLSCTEEVGKALGSHPRLPGNQPTPLLHLNHQAPLRNLKDIYVRDESHQFDQIRRQLDAGF